MIQSVPVFLPHFAATTCFYFMSLRQTVRLLNSYLVAEQAVWTILLWGWIKMFAKVKSTSGQSFVFIFVIYCRNFSTLMTFLSNTHHGDYTIIISDLPTLLWHKWNCAVSVVGWLVTASGCWSQLGDYCTSAINTNSSGWVAGGTKANKFHANWQIHSLDGGVTCLLTNQPTNCWWR